MTEYKHYLRSEECVGLSMLHVSKIALHAAIEKLTGDSKHKGQGRLERMCLYSSVMSLLSQISIIENAVLNSEPDDDHRAGVARKINAYQVELKAAPQVSQDFHVVAQSDMETLVRFALDECSLNCPCLITNEGDGSTTVITEAVKGCEMRKLFKRILLSEIEGGFCPYYGR